MLPPHAARRSFDLSPGRLLGGRYVVKRLLGAGWEGEVYEVVEARTGIRRAAKLFFPERNVRDQAIRFYANKLERLRGCSMVIQYAHSDTARLHGGEVTFLVSEFGEGTLLSELVGQQPGRRFSTFEALHLVYAVTQGVAEIHDAGEYHGDLHDDNVLVARRGVFFDVRLLDFYPRGRRKTEHLRNDVIDVVHLLYQAVGGSRRYATQPRQVKAICRGLRRGLILRTFPTIHHLRAHLESLDWTDR